MIGSILPNKIMLRGLRAILCLCVLCLTGCESTELKDAGNDVLDVVHNGVDLITEAGNKAGDAMKSTSDKEDIDD